MTGKHRHGNEYFWTEVGFWLGIVMMIGGCVLICISGV
jgi:uncharacterized membrane protein